MSLLCLYDFGSSNVNDFKLIKGYKRSKLITFEKKSRSCKFYRSFVGKKVLSTINYNILDF